MDALDIALGNLGQLLGIEGLAFEDDECQIEIGGTLVDLLADRARQRLALGTLAGEIADERRATLVPALLAANCHPAMAGAAVGVPAGSDAVVVTDQVEAQGLGTRGLESALELFLGAVDHVRGLLGAPEAPGHHVDAPPGSGEIMLRL